MNRDRHRQISDLFLKACKLDLEEREAFLNEQCHGDPDLLAEVQSLLAQDEQSPESLGAEDLQLSAIDYQTEPDAQPDRVGHYRLLRRLGEGGMGVVYLAEQEEPIRRRVALKLIKLGMDTEQVVARFESERQALAVMDHQCVARVFDAGATAQGRPYFVMEYVDGMTITEYSDRNRLATRERLKLFTQVCEGIQHAHQKGIIHRDLKPSNILVTTQDDRAVPKIIDFGVAKATEHRLTENTFFTEHGQLIGTPEYMSPEQAEKINQDIDTRTDVYSLGVLLYELLVGALPFDPQELRKAGFDEIRRRICEDEPAKPSTRISTLGDASAESAKRRRTDPGSLAKQVRGDLDWITMRALEKDRTLRYGSPVDLAADIDRHLTNQPVSAGPPGAKYRAWKFVRRHRVGVGATASMLVVLVAFTVTTKVQSQRIKREAQTSERAAGFLANMLGEVEPEAMGQLLVTGLRERIEAAQRARGATDEEVTAVLESFTNAMNGVNATDVGLRLLDKEVLSRAGRTIEQQLTEEPLIAARLKHTIGRTYYQLGLYKRAEPHILQAMNMRQEILGSDHRDTLYSMSYLAELYAHQGRHNESELLLLKVLKTCEHVLGDDHSDTLNFNNNLANLYLDQGRLEEAEALHLETLKTQKRVLGDDHPDTLYSKMNLANLYTHQGRYSEAELLYIETLEAKKRTLGNDHQETIDSMYNLANLYTHHIRSDEAEPLLLKVLGSYERALGDDHPDTLRAMSTLAMLYWYQESYDEAEQLLLKTLNTYKRVLGEDHPDTLSSMHNLAILYKDLHRYDEAEQLCIKTLETKKRMLGVDHPATLQSMNNLAILYYSQRRYDEAEPLYIETLETKKRVLGDDHPDTLNSMYNLAALYQIQGRYDEAEPLYINTLKIAKRVFGDDSLETISFMNNLSRQYTDQHRYSEAEALYLMTLQTQKRHLGDDHPNTLTTMHYLATLHKKQRHYEEAAPLYLDILEIRKRIHGNDHPKTAASFYNLACLEAVRGDASTALDWLRQATDAGYTNADWMLKDADLESLHGVSEFETIVAEVKKRIGKD